ncbi:WYL domain-containing protein [Paenibacillus sp. FSL H7-0331]|uniref:WYL domain-containing protein n=1 Tax=Paenibacillus sp. FSL H7-0331 TaxID=1920421 RepID=UPI002681D5C1|nr:WYL domain-containing protein [Paenibacillus sp. FSL H7-0331]
MNLNLFEKIFNYQIISRLEDSGTFMITSHERSWLKTMLQHPAAEEAFTAATLGKLQQLLEPESMMDITEAFMEKARSTERQVYHAYLRPLRRAIMNQQGICISYQVKGGRTKLDELGFPYKLEYSMVKKEWYLLWYHQRRATLMSTRLHKILAVAEEALPDPEVAQYGASIHAALEQHKASTSIQVLREYNRELSRILYAFSCFEKEVDYDAELDLYTIQVTFAKNETDYMLSKLRFLGKRVRIVGDPALQQRMYETTVKALDRYADNE